jgi:hypothetical protein
LAVDAAALIGHLEIADLALAKRAEGGRRTAVGHRLADADFGSGDAAEVGGGEGEGDIGNATAQSTANLVTRRIGSPPILAPGKAAVAGAL